MEEEIIRLLKERGPLPVHHLARELRATYGAVQYYTERLMKRRKIYTAKVGARRYAPLLLRPDAGARGPGRRSGLPDRGAGRVGAGLGGACPSAQPERICMKEKYGFLNMYGASQPPPR